MHLHKFVLISYKLLIKQNLYCKICQRKNQSQKVYPLWRNWKLGEKIVLSNHWPFIDENLIFSIIINFYNTFIYCQQRFCYDCWKIFLAINRFQHLKPDWNISIAFQVKNWSWLLSRIFLLYQRENEIFYINRE